MSCHPIRAILWATVVAAAVAPNAAQAVTVYRDDFNANWNFQQFGGAVPPGGIWNGLNNAGNGGDVFDANITSPGNLRMGMQNVGWGGGAASGRQLYKTVDASEFRSVRAKISSQTSGFWSTAGVMARVPSSVADPADDDWIAVDSFRVTSAAADAFGGFGISLQLQNVINGVRNADLNTSGLTEADVAYVRLDNLGGGDFQGFGSADGVNWVKYWDFTNPDLASGPLEVGLFGADNLADLAGAVVEFDWVEIHTGVIPEPTTLGCLGAVLAGLSAVRRRSRG